MTKKKSPAYNNETLIGQLYIYDGEECVDSVNYGSPETLRRVRRYARKQINSYPVSGKGYSWRAYTPKNKLAYGESHSYHVSKWTHQ